MIKTYTAGDIAIAVVFAVAIAANLVAAVAALLG